MKQNVVLKGKSVYAEIIKIDEEPLLDKNQVPYKRYAYQAVAFILREPAYKCFDSGDMAELTLVPTTREQEIIDPELGTGTGQFSTRDGWAYGGHLTQEQDLKLEVFEVRKESLRKGTLDRVLQQASPAVAASIMAQGPETSGYPGTSNMEKNPNKEVKLNG